MLTRLESALGRRLLVTTDHEGGRIIMLGASVTIFPDNLAAGTAGEVAFAKQQGLIEGRELRRLGVDVSFGPVLDVLTEHYSPNIGICSYGKDPDLCIHVGPKSALELAQRVKEASPDAQVRNEAGPLRSESHGPGIEHEPRDALGVALGDRP